MILESPTNASDAAVNAEIAHEQSEAVLPSINISEGMCVCVCR